MLKREERDDTGAAEQGTELLAGPTLHVVRCSCQNAWVAKADVKLGNVIEGVVEPDGTLRDVRLVRPFVGRGFIKLSAHTEGGTASDNLCHRFVLGKCTAGAQCNFRHSIEAEDEQAVAAIRERRQQQQAKSAEVPAE